MSDGRYRPYPRYKPTGAAWLESVPESWDIFDGKRIFESCRETAHSTDEQLAASQKFGVVPQSLMMELNDAKVMLALTGTSTFRHVEQHDFVISLRSFEGGIEYSAYTGCVSPAYTVLRPTKRIVSAFYKHLFKSRPYISALQATTDSLRDGKAINYEQFGAIPLILPPLPEQTQIAKFLDHETAKIDRLIEKQEALIRLLKEKRQAVISHAVTKGLNPHAPLKDSGIEWLGKVPAHWKVAKCGYYLRVLPGYAFPSAGFSDDESHAKLLRGINVGVSAIKWDEAVYWKRRKNDGLDEFELEAGELVIGMDRPLISEGIRVAQIQESDLPCLLLQRVAALKTSNLVRPRFLHALLSSPMFGAHFAPETTGVSVPHISPDQIKSFAIPIPPHDEQDEILNQISGFISKSDVLVSEATRAALLLQERRTALISAAVTGKIDVRQWQPPDASLSAN